MQKHSEWVAVDHDGSPHGDSPKRYIETDWNELIECGMADTAALIVRAVNAHQSLVDALERILYAHDTGNNGASMGEAVLCREYAERARAALAKAKA